jgi:FkbM family methyltransferase
MKISYERMQSTLIGTPLQQLAEGVRWLLGSPKRWRSPELRDVYLEGERSRELFRKAIQDGMNCVDVGCHLGIVLNEFIRLSPHGHHIAVEPIPYKAHWLRKKFPRVQVHQVALDEKEGQREFFVDRTRSAYSSWGSLRVGREKIDVECRRLDDIVPGDLRVDFIKIDVEGAELNVFRGASRVLTENRPVVLFECTKGHLENMGIKASDVFHQVDSLGLGYRIFTIKSWLTGGDPLDLTRFEESMVYPFQAFNYVLSIGSCIHMRNNDRR